MLAITGGGSCAGEGEGSEELLGTGFGDGRDPFAVVDGWADDVFAAGEAVPCEVGWSGGGVEDVEVDAIDVGGAAAADFVGVGEVWADAGAGVIGDDAEGEAGWEGGGEDVGVDGVAAVAGFEAIGVLVAVRVVAERVGAGVGGTDERAGIGFVLVVETIAIGVGDGGIGFEARGGWGDFRAVFEPIAVGVGGFGVEVREAGGGEGVFLSVGEGVGVEVA